MKTYLFASLLLVVSILVFMGCPPEEDDFVPYLPGGSGEPSIFLTVVPAIGSHENLRGQVWHVWPSENMVAVYIKYNGWWTKPYFNSPVTSISYHGGWTCDITTGGQDPQATEVAAFLIPLGYSPPQASGFPSLPAGLFDNALDWVIVARD
ncbi:MAG: hypothetical protein WDZ85_01765 [Candidatus Paceibacterota bacterium]